MALPEVEGWLIDYRTAEPIFDGQNNAGINHLVGMCQQGELFICHTEEGLFREHNSLKPAFLGDQRCVCEPSDDDFHRSQSIAQIDFNPPIRRNDETTIFISAVALSNNLGVITNQVSTRFATVSQLGTHFGFPVLSWIAFAEAIGI
tara:strand:+ start:894 stop:1334 length:441 start_codon:yes stop_codon:yes gene_type:complete